MNEIGDEEFYVTIEDTYIKRINVDLYDILRTKNEKALLKIKGYIEKLLVDKYE